MRIYRAIENGSGTTIQQQDGVFGPRTEKSIEKLSGDGEWVHLHGVKLMVDPSGIIIKGPDVFIGRKFEDVKRLNYSDTFGVMRSVARATMQTNKAMEDDIDKLARQGAWKEAHDLLDSMIKAHKEAAEKFENYKK